MYLQFFIGETSILFLSIEQIHKYQVNVFDFLKS